jgi:hypothetical protein
VKAEVKPRPLAAIGVLFLATLKKRANRSS